MKFLEEMHRYFRILPFDRRSALLAGAMASVLDSEGERIPEGDILIAASSIVWGDGVIVTADSAHFRRLRRFGLVVTDG